MSDYKQDGNRWTAIYIRRSTPLFPTFQRATFDMVRFNTDTDPYAKPVIVPVGSDVGKIFERIWIVDEVPFKRQFFGGQK